VVSFRISECPYREGKNRISELQTDMDNNKNAAQDWTVLVKYRFL
jgi:hypothetical protein